MKRNKYWLWLFALAVILSSCTSPAAPTTTQVDPNSIATAAVKTYEAKLTLQAASAVTDTPQPPTAAPVMTATEAVTPTPAVLYTPLPTAGDTGDHAEFVKDVTYPDNAEVKGGKQFTKIWRLINAGTTTWTPEYKLVYYSGDWMGVQRSAQIPVDVPPGATVDVSVEMMAPDTAGTYQSNWMLVNAAGASFGIGPKADQPIYAKINVSTQVASSDATQVIETLYLSDISLDVDTNHVSGPCPYTFNLTVKFHVRQPSEVSYRLDVYGSDQIGSPQTTTVNLTVGDYTYNHTLTLTNDFDGEVVLRFLKPTTTVAASVPISINCNTR